MNGYVKIKNGSYRNQPINNKVFPLIKQFQLGSNGGFITVDGTGMFGKDKIRVSVASPTDYEVVDASDYQQPNQTSESDEEIIERIGQRFSILDDMTKAVLN